MICPTLDVKSNKYIKWVKVIVAHFVDTAIIIITISYYKVTNFFGGSRK